LNKRIISAILIILASLAFICTPTMIYARIIPDTAKDYNQINCGEPWEYYFWEKVPSLSIEKIEGNSDNKLSVIVELQPAEMPGDPWADEWEAEAKVYFDGKKIGVFDIRKPTYPEDGIDSYSYGKYTYILPWEITSPAMVKVVILAKGVIDTGGVQKYLFNEVTKQEMVEPVQNTSSEPTNNNSKNSIIQLPIILGLIGFIIILCILYQRYGTRLFRHKH